MSASANNHRVTVDLLRRYDRPGPRYTSYPTAPMWGDGVTNQEYREALQSAAQRTEEPLALYCHIPFCRSRCFYCGCNTCATRDTGQMDKYLQALHMEMGSVEELLGNARAVSQLHFGGGTPTYIGVEQLRDLITRLGSHFELAADCEMSIEVDPRITSAVDISGLREIGFNRISFGVQDFDSTVQRAIGRIQSADQVRALLEAARRAGYKGINFDLIYGLPRQTPESFQQTIETVLAMGPDRVALYSFAYLPRLRPNQAKIREADLPDTETKYQLFSDAMNAFIHSGYRQIGMDHFALPQDELALAQRDGRLHRNFMGYTVQAAPEMIGLGMSSIGYINETFVQNASSLDVYEEMMRKSSLAVYRGLRLSCDDLVRQYVIGNLMCNFRVLFRSLEEKFKVAYSDYFAAEDAGLEPFLRDGLLVRGDDGLHVTPVGRTFVRNIAMTFDHYLRDRKKSTVFSRTI